MSLPGDRNATDPAAVFRDLNPAQADGLTCVVCNTAARAQVPVGRSAGGSQVFACLVSCAPAVGFVPPAAGAEVVSVR